MSSFVVERNVVSRHFSLPMPVEKSLGWCGRQVSRLTSDLPSKHAFKEILYRIGVVVSVIIPLLGLIAYRLGLCESSSSIQAPAKSSLFQIPLDAKVQEGYGEYILRFRNNQNIVDLATYGKAHEVIEKFEVTRWMADHPTATAQDRSEALRKAIAEIHPDLILTFIPKTLFELLFIREVIEEDLQKIRGFSYATPGSPTAREVDNLRELCQASHNSWLKISPTQEIHHRLNTRLQILCNQKNFGADLVMGQMVSLLENQVHFLEKVVPDYEQFASCSDPSFFSHFSTESQRGGLKGLRFSNESMANILRQALYLECSQAAQGKAILYRGGKTKEDLPTFTRDDGKSFCYSLSYGNSLFAGFVHDPEAMAFRYMKMRDRDAYALFYDPHNASDRDLLFCPPALAVKTLFGSGEFFHGRSKAYQQNANEKVRGYLGMLDIAYEAFPHKSPLEKNRFTALFQQKMQEAILLKPAQSR